MTLSVALLANGVLLLLVGLFLSAQEYGSRRAHVVAALLATAAIALLIAAIWTEYAL